MDTTLGYLRESLSNHLEHGIGQNIYRKIVAYESLHEEFGFKNNQAQVSIKAIEQKYQEMILNGHITNKEEEWYE